MDKLSYILTKEKGIDNLFLSKIVRNFQILRLIFGHIPYLLLLLDGIHIILLK